MARASGPGGYESNILACRALTEAQINFLILPADVFEAREYFRTVFDREKKVLRVNGQELHALVVSGCDYLTGPVAEFIAEAAANGFRVVFTSHYPLGVSDRSAEESAALAEAFRKNWSCVPVKELGKAFGDFPAVRRNWRSRNASSRFIIIKMKRRSISS